MESKDLLAQECEAARRQCVLMDHSDYSILEINGKDRLDFLHRMVTSDLKTLKPNQGLETCLLNAQAKVLAHFILLCFQNNLWIISHESLKERIITVLNQAIITDEVNLTDITGEFKMVSIHGPKAKPFLTALTHKEFAIKELNHAEIGIDGTKIIFLKINLIGENGFLLIIPQKNINQAETLLLEEGEEYGLVQIHKGTAETLRIEAGISCYGTDFDDTHLLPETGLNHTVSYTKGCFPGQEVLARIDSRGHINKKLAGFELKGEKIPEPGNKIMRDSRDIGYVTSAVFSPTLKKTIGFGYVDKDFQTPGCEINIKTGEDLAPARIKPLPFYSSKE